MNIPSIDPGPRAGSMPRVRVTDSAGLEVRHHALPASPAFEQACRDLARRAAPAGDPHIFEERLHRYEWALTAYRRGRMHAFLLGQTRSIGGDRFVYFGPLYSMHGAFLPLFAHALRSLGSACAPFWLVAEIEHPRLRPLFTHLVPSSWPRQSGDTPIEILRGVEALAAALGHVHGLDGETLRTSCSGADAQLVVVRAPTPDAAGRVVRDLDDAMAVCRTRRSRRPTEPS
jgi:hypothetical protein